MNTKLTALLTAATLAFTPLSAFGADYYPDVKFPVVNSQDFVAYNIDINDYNSAEDEVRKSARLGADELDEALSILDAIAAEAQSAYALAYIKASQHNTEENNAAVTQIYTTVSQISEKMSSLIMDLYNDASTRSAVTEWIGGKDMMQEFIDTYPTERFYELNEQENQLLNKYRNHTFGTYVYETEDGSFTYSDLEKRMSEIVNEMNANIENDSYDYAKAYSEYEKLSGYALDYFDKSSCQLGEIFCELIRVRGEIAKEAGFDSYADYMHSVIYGRDYTTEDIATLRESAKKHIVPLLDKLSSLGENMETHLITEDEISGVIKEHIGKISPELQKSYDYMLESNLVDFEPSLDKVTPGIAYTIDVPAYSVPFIFISPVEGNTSWTFETLVHEFGHFNANLYNTLSASDEAVIAYTPDIDLSEVHSQGLEVLFADYYDEIYPRNSLIMYYNKLYSLLSSIAEGCALDEWQQYVYTNPGLGVDEMSEAYTDICISYGIEPTYTYEWTQIPHNFEEPMYYISYAVSAVAALDLWAESLNDRSSAVDRYMKTTINTGLGFAQTLDILGYNDIFAEETVKSIADTIYTHATLGYGDISVNDWYWQAMLETSTYMDDAINSGNFRPQDGILRSEMANTIGKMYEQFGYIIPDATSPFTDAQGKYIAWAGNEGIIRGYDALTFGSADTLTREQAVTILYRYAKGRATSDVSSLANFRDYSDISHWAQEAFVWAVNEGIIRGINIDESTSLLNPQGTVTRAEAAQMIARLNDYHITP